MREDQYQAEVLDELKMQDEKEVRGWSEAHGYGDKEWFYHQDRESLRSCGVSQEQLDHVQGAFDMIFGEKK